MDIQVINIDDRINRICDRIKTIDIQDFNYIDKILLFRRGLGLTLKATRESKNLSIREVSKVTKINIKTIILIEQGEIGSESSDIKKIALYLNAYSYVCSFFKSIEEAFEAKHLLQDYLTSDNTRIC